MRRFGSTLRSMRVATGLQRARSAQQAHSDLAGDDLAFLEVNIDKHGMAKITTWGDGV